MPLGSIANQGIQRGNQNLSLILSEEEFIRYGRACSPCLVAFAQSVPILPTHNTSPAPWSRASNPAVPSTTQNQTGPTQLHGSPSPLRTQDFVPPPHRQPHESNLTNKDIFWCVDSVFVEPLETILCPVTIRSSMDDFQLFDTANGEIDKINRLRLGSWIPSLPSFKSCTRCRFIKVSR